MWKVIFATIIIFGSGVITGGLLVSYADRVGKPRPKTPSVATVPPWQLPPNEMGRRNPRDLQFSLEQRRIEFIANASRELDLTPEQRDHIEKIIRTSQDHTRELSNQIAPEMRKELSDVKDQIRAELTPEQKRRFEEMLKRPRKPEEPANRQPRRTPP